MFVVAGLGNPGVAYRDSRHNAGYRALDALAGALHIRVSKRGFSGVYGEGIVSGTRVVLVKPETYMNLSGDCVQRILHFFKAPPQNLIVLYDDIDLPVGSLRIRASGSAGTHNGMRSVVACVGTEDFARVRIGVGRQGSGELKDYVLARPSKAECEALDAATQNAAEAVRLILRGDIAQAQAAYNRKHEGAEAGSAPREV